MGLKDHNITVDDDGIPSKNTYDLSKDKKLTEALEWSRKGSERRQGSIRETVPDMQQVYQDGINEVRIICPECDTSLSYEGTKSDGTCCMCGKKLLKADGSTCDGVTLITGEDA